MPLLSIDAVVPGSVLAAAATDARGNVLVGEGRVLTEEWLQRLKARGVSRLSVTPPFGEAGGTPAAVEAPADRLRLERFDGMFARAPQEPLMQALSAAARQVLTERKA